MHAHHPIGALGGRGELRYRDGGRVRREDRPHGERRIVGSEKLHLQLEVLRRRFDRQVHRAEVGRALCRNNPEQDGVPFSRRKLALLDELAELNRQDFQAFFGDVNARVCQDDAVTTRGGNLRDSATHLPRSDHPDGPECLVQHARALPEPRSATHASLSARKVHEAARGGGREQRVELAFLLQSSELVVAAYRSSVDENLGHRGPSRGVDEPVAQVRAIVREDLDERHSLRDEEALCYDAIAAVTGCVEGDSGNAWVGHPPSVIVIASDAMTEQGVLRLEKFGAEAKQFVAAAQQLADERGHGEVLPLHVLVRALERSAGVAAVFRSAGAEPQQLADHCERALRKLARGGGVAYVSVRLLDLIERAEREAGRDGLSEVGVAQLLNALSQEIRGAVGDILAHFVIGPGGLRDHLGELERSTKLSGAANPKPPAAFDLVRDLVAEARTGPFEAVIGRDAELRRLLQIITRRSKNHPLIVGEPGVGKTTLIRAFAQRLANGEAPSNLAGARLWALDTGALVAGAKLRGELEARLKSVIEKLIDSNGGDSILVIEELHSLFTGGPPGAGLGELLKPILERGDVCVLATTTVEGLQKIQERDAAVVRRFASFVVEPASPELSQQILRGIAARFERHHQVQIAEGAVRAAVGFARRYLADRALPDSAVDLLDETASRRRVEVDGLPVQDDIAMRRLETLEAQLAGVSDDPTALGGRVRGELEAEASALRPKVAALRAGLTARRGALQALQLLRKEQEKLEAELTLAREAKNDARVGELEHVVLPGVVGRVGAAKARAEESGARTMPVLVDENDVAVTVNEWTGIPVAKMLEGETEKLLKMEERLAKQVIGQAEACTAVSRAVRRGRVGLRDPGKPIGSFLFLGPSGVGKTYFAKKLAEFLFDDEQALTRLDMSEFMEKHMAQRLIGSPPGYADSEQGGFLTEAVRRRPYSVLLFDEVEKAHADVFNLLLQLLDDGRLTDGRGRTADFSNTVIVMTSNIGSKRILEAEPKLFESDEGREALRDVVQTELRSFFRPELLNRLDEVIVFKGLQKLDLRGILEAELGRLDKMLRERDMKVVLTDAAKDRLVDLGYEPALGARPLKRAILRELQNPLAQAILEGGALSAGAIQVDLGPEGLVFRRAD